MDYLDAPLQKDPTRARLAIVGGSPRITSGVAFALARRAAERDAAAAPLPPERLLVGVVAALALLGGAGAPASAVGGLGLRLVEPPTLTQNCARVVDGDLSASALLRDGRRAWLVTPLSSRWVAAAGSDFGARYVSARRAPRSLLRSPLPLAAAPRCLRL